MMSWYHVHYQFVRGRGEGVCEKFLFLFPLDVLIQFNKQRTTKKRFCSHTYSRFDQSCGRDLLVCRKCGTVTEVYE